MRQANRKTKFLTIHLARELHGRIAKMARAAKMPIGRFAAQVLLEAAVKDCGARARLNPPGEIPGWFAAQLLVEAANAQADDRPKTSDGDLPGRQECEGF